MVENGSRNMPCNMCYKTYETTQKMWMSS